MSFVSLMVPLPRWGIRRVPPYVEAVEVVVEVVVVPILSNYEVVAMEAVSPILPKWEIGIVLYTPGSEMVVTEIGAVKMVVAEIGAVEMVVTEIGAVNLLS